MQVNSTPIGANVFVNGEKKGETLITLVLDPGKYTIRISKKDYIEVSKKDIVIIEGNNNEISETLTPIQPDTGGPQDVTSYILLFSFSNEDFSIKAYLFTWREALSYKKLSLSKESRFSLCTSVT